jgi:prevent-host-death family protein
MSQYSIAEARNRFTAIVRDVERGKIVELTRHGRPVAVILSMREYRQLQPAQSDFWAALSLFRQQVDLEPFNTGPDVFEGARDPSPGRQVNL